MTNNHITLHIGVPKTGSSSIQKYLKHNQRGLIDGHGIGYFRGGWKTLQQGVAGDTAALGQFLELMQSTRRTIISDEKLASLQSDALRQLGRFLATLTSEIEILIYLRRQDEVAVSGHLTRLINGWPHRLAEGPFRPPMDYLSIITGWETVFGRNALTIRRFGSPYFARNELIADFTEATALPSSLEPTPIRNRSPSLEALELARLISLAMGETPSRRMVLKLIANADLPGQAIGLSRGQRLRLLDEVEDSNRVVAERYFGTRELFTHPIPDNGGADILLTPDQVLDMTASIFERFKLPISSFPLGLNLDTAIAFAAAELTRNVDQLSANYANENGRSVTSAGLISI